MAGNEALSAALAEAIHPTPGKCGPDSSGCTYRHHAASVDALNLLGHDDFALARQLLTAADAPAAIDAEVLARALLAVHPGHYGYWPASNNEGVPYHLNCRHEARRIEREYTRLLAEARL